MYLYVGSNATSVQGREVRLEGRRCFTPVYPPPSLPGYGQQVEALLDSGAFSDPPHKRLTPERALDRQIQFEQKASTVWGHKWQAAAFVSYDLLIDEKWDGGRRRKERWSVAEANAAVGVTVDAAYYLVSQRERLTGRTLVLACQGVDAVQYDECVAEVLKVAQPQDWIGLGGWCILGRFSRQWMPTFWQTIERVIPRIANAGVRHVHIFGVLYQPALGVLLWHADQYGVSVSTDSAAPVLACSFPDLKKSGARAPTWEANVQWWRKTLSELRQGAYYSAPPSYQLALAGL